MVVVTGAVVVVAFCILAKLIGCIFVSVPLLRAVRTCAVTPALALSLHTVKETAMSAIKSGEKNIQKGTAPKSDPTSQPGTTNNSQASSGPTTVTMPL